MSGNTGGTPYSSDTLYLRRYRVIVGKNGGTMFDVSNLHCTFTVEKSMTQTPNYSEIVIYNLSAATENTLIMQGDRVVLEAGYVGQQYGLIFDGDVVQPLRDKPDNVTYTLTLVSQDADVFLNQGVVNASYAAGQSPSTIVQAVATGATNPAEVGYVSPNLEDVKLARGKVGFGLARDYLRDVAKTEQAAFYVDEGKVQIVKAADTPTGQMINLSPQSGLIGAPEQQDDGISVKCLLNPSIKLNSFVHIDNSLIRRAKITRSSTTSSTKEMTDKEKATAAQKAALRELDNDGIYRVISLKHAGDTRGNDWYTSFTGISQVASLPQTGSSMT